MECIIPTLIPDLELRSFQKMQPDVFLLELKNLVDILAAAHCNHRMPARPIVFTQFMIALCDEPIGYISYKENRTLHTSDANKIEIAYWVDRDKRGHGYAKAAVAALTTYLHAAAYQNVYACTCADNQPSEAVLMHCGFMLEHTKQDMHLFAHHA